MHLLFFWNAANRAIPPDEEISAVIYDAGYGALVGLQKHTVTIGPHLSRAEVEVPNPLTAVIDESQALTGTILPGEYPRAEVE
jgi:hypothetical protein